MNSLSSKVDSLVRVYLNGSHDATLSRKLLRRLRPATGIVDSKEAAQRLRRLLIGNNLATAQFSKECETLLRLSPTLHDGFIIFLEALVSAPAPSRISFLSDSVDHTSLGLPTPKSSSITHDPGESNGKHLSIPFAVNNEADIAERKVEVEIIRDLLYIFQGLPSKRIKYDSKNERYLIDPSLRLSAPQRDIVTEMCELGWLHKLLLSFINTAENPSSAKGLTVQAFAYALQEELQDFKRLLAVLEKEVTADSSSSGNSTDGDNITLLSLKVWLRSPLDRMGELAQLVDATQSLHGGALLSRLHGHTRLGDKAAVATVVRITTSSAVPFFHALKRSFIITVLVLNIYFDLCLCCRWILYGELSDLYEEFFVTTQPVAASAPQGMNIWHDCYCLRRAMIPAFIPEALAEAILVIGKSINFTSRYKHYAPVSKVESDKANRRVPLKQPMAKPSIQEALGIRGLDADGDLGAQRKDVMRAYAAKMAQSLTDGAEPADEATVPLEVEDEGPALADMESGLAALKYGSEAALTQIVKKVSASVDRSLLRMLVKDFHVFEHLQALKKFMLLGQGDFVTCLMDSVGPELQKSPSKLHRHNLTGHLEGALRSSNAQFEPTYILNRVSVRLLEAAPGDTGWEVFTLDYAIDAPLIAVVNYSFYYLYLSVASSCAVYRCTRMPFPSTGSPFTCSGD